MASVIGLRRFLVRALLPAWMLTHSMAGLTRDPGPESFYLVFEQSGDGPPVLVYQRRVTLAAPLRSQPDDPMEAMAGVGPDAVLVRVLSDQHDLLFEDRVALDQQIRAEFPTLEGDWNPVQAARPATRSFVVRIPAVTSGTLELQARETTQFPLSAIHADTAVAATRQLQSARSFSQGDSANRVDLLIIGEGYTSAEAAKFEGDAADAQADFLSASPYNEYQAFLKFSRLFVASAESGADHPPYDENCSASDPGCCADAAASSDPLAGTFVDTAFDARYCTSNIHRLLTADNSKVFATAAAFPDWDHIILVVNDETYGGAGGSISVTSASSQGISVLRHEYGHAFTRLADEYDSPFPGYPQCSDIGAGSCEANVTDVTTRDDIKWEEWIANDTPVPTPEEPAFNNDVGLFEGARYLAAGMYRPKNNCHMNTLAADFCEVCQEAYVLRLYEGGWGVPEAGIDLIDPGSESPQPGAVAISGKTRFSVDMVMPTTGLDIEWRVNGAPWLFEPDGSLEFDPPQSGEYHIRLTVTDDTGKVHRRNADEDLMSSERSWNVTATVQPGVDINQGMSDAWVSDDAPFQGFFFTVYPQLGVFFLSWFTFDSVIPDGQDPATFGAHDQRWITGLGVIEGDSVSVSAELTTGGVFNSSDPLALQIPDFGTIDISFADCNTAELSYEFPSLGLDGEMTLSRALDSGVALCEALSGD